MLADKHLEHVAVDVALHRDHLATSETDPAEQVRPLALAVGRVLTTTVGGGAALATRRVAVPDARTDDDAALVHADDPRPVDGLLPLGERLALGYDVGSESLHGSDRLFLSVSAIRSSVRPTVCWHTTGWPASPRRAANSCCGTDTSSASHARSIASPAGVTRRGFPPARGARSTDPVSRLILSHRPSEATPTAKRSAMVAWFPSPRSYASTARRRRSAEIAMGRAERRSYFDHSYTVTLYLRAGADPNSPTPIQNPIIILDGFDLSDYDPETGEYVDRLKTYNTVSLYNNLNQDTNLSDNLRASGYDLVFVDYKDSQDFIERNALGVVDVIEDIQALMPPDRDINALIGLSMGGLVGRYALLKMEETGIHRVRRFISFDSPQQGANVPVSFQYFVRDFAFTGGAAGSFRRVFDSPAFRELVYYNIYTTTHDPLQANLYNWFGDRYPILTFNSAIANGGSGVAQLRNPKLPSDGRISPGFEMVSFKTGGFSIPGTHFLTGVYYDWDLLAAPVRSTSNQAVYKAEPIVCVKFIGLCAESPVGGWFGHVQSGNTYDSAPGSWRASSAELTNPIETGTTGYILDRLWFITNFGIQSDTYADVQTFVPTLNALDYTPYGRSHSQLLSNLYNNQILEYNVASDGAARWAERSPFDEIYFAGRPDYPGANENYTHVFNPQPDVVTFLQAQLQRSISARPTYTNAYFTDGITLGDANLAGLTQADEAEITVGTGSTVILTGTYRGHWGSYLKVRGTLIVQPGAAIEKGVRLNIYPGGRVIFRAGSRYTPDVECSLFVNGGRLEVEGTAAQPVRFTPYNSNTSVYNTRSLTVGPGGTASIDYAVFDGLDPVKIEGGSITARNVVVLNGLGSGVRITSYGSLDIRNSRISGAVATTSRFGNSLQTNGTGLRVESGTVWGGYSVVQGSQAGDADMRITGNAGHGVALGSQSGYGYLHIGECFSPYGEPGCSYDAADYDSNPWAIPEIISYGPFGGRNAIRDNSLGGVGSLSGDFVAQQTYWGPSGPPSGVSALGAFNVEPHLNSDPGSGSPFTAGRAAARSSASDSLDGTQTLAEQPEPTRDAAMVDAYRALLARIDTSTVGGLTAYASLVRNHDGADAAEQFLAELLGRPAPRNQDIVMSLHAWALLEAGRAEDAVREGSRLLVRGGIVGQDSTWDKVRMATARTVFGAYLRALEDAEGARRAIGALARLGDIEALSGALEAQVVYAEEDPSYGLLAPLPGQVGGALQRGARARLVVDLEGPGVSEEAGSGLALKTREAEAAPLVLALSSFPNPIHGTGRVQLDLPAPAAVRAAVYDVLGREVVRLVAGDLEAGRHLLRFDASGLASGVYVVRAEVRAGAPQAVLVRRITVAH